MHLRAPSFDHGFISFLWAVGLALFIWIGLRAFVIACLSGLAIFLFVRVYGEEEPRLP